ncbi:MAG: hypothetical protein K0Q49_2088 [Haloplasmataceae bacterium]|jgi:hypothetical protein|nr:hypothetical protein [Haloplasmataceae bacterium]
MLILKKVMTFIRKFMPLVLVLIAVLFYFIARFMDNHNIWLEKYYSSSLNKWTIQGLSQLTGMVSFSTGEILLIGHVLAVPVLLILLIYKIIKRKFFKYIKHVVLYISIIYILFMLLWGFNYKRISISQIMHLEVKPTDTQVLYVVSEILLLRANSLRSEINEDSNGVMTIEGGYQSVFNRAYLGYQVIGEDYKELAGRYGKPKFVLLSEPMLYTGIVGVYFPFTAEANVNVATPILFTPIDALHEMAHQRGFASEDEANYIAYLTATAHPDIDFQYSGTLSALTSTMNALWSYDPEGAAELVAMYSDGLKRDLTNYNVFWKDYAGEVSDVANDVNDSYLKGNGQTDGVQSYGRVVDLLLAHYRKFGDI